VAAARAALESGADKERKDKDGVRCGRRRSALCAALRARSRVTRHAPRAVRSNAAVVGCGEGPLGRGAAAGGARRGQGDKNQRALRRARRRAAPRTPFARTCCRLQLWRRGGGAAARGRWLFRARTCIAAPELSLSVRLAAAPPRRAASVLVCAAHTRLHLARAHNIAPLTPFTPELIPLPHLRVRLGSARCVAARQSRPPPLSAMRTRCRAALTPQPLLLPPLRCAAVDARRLA
jgi:hypothetical protein